MGRSKDLFMQDRESDIFETENPFFNEPKKSHSDPFESLNNAFISQMEDYEDGNVDALETAIKMRKDYERLEIQMNLRKTWFEENKESINNEADKYPAGFKGYKIGTHTSTKYDYKNIPEWVNLKAKLTEIESNAKETLKAVEKGKTVVDEDGCVLIPAKVNRTYSVKFDKVK